MNLPTPSLDWLALTFAGAALAWSGLALLLSVLIEMPESSRRSRLRPTLRRSAPEPPSAAEHAEALIFAHRYSI